jgi:hypothetical protein
MKLPLKVNGRDITVETSESVMLVDVLRDQVGLTPRHLRGAWRHLHRAARGSGSPRASHGAAGLGKSPP